jgi:flagellar biosynthesis protein FlhF
MKRHLFRGKDLRETLAKVREALGPEAVIFATRRVRGEGGDYFEVEAAEWSESMPGPAPEPASAAPREPETQAPRAPLSPARETGPAPAPEAASDLSPLIVSSVYTELVESGLREETSRELIVQAAGSLTSTEKDSPEPLRERVAGLLTFLFEAGGPVRTRRPEEAGPAVANFIGPTGVGKTTTVAKIAAECTRRRRLKVGLVGVDVPGAGAVERLRSFANSMRLPFLAVSSPVELDDAIARFAKADVVLVDAPGTVLGNPAGAAALQSFFGEGRRGQNYLVLAANTHPDDMARMSLRFSCVPLHRLVFTKLDESSRFGVIFERHMELGVRVAYFTTGQRMPQDLEVASPARMARLILPAVRRHGATAGASA